MQLYLVRHSRPAIAEGICYGQTDIEPVSETLGDDSNLITKKLAGNRIDGVISSPLKRCSELARILHADSTTAFSCDVRLMELNFGRWEMQAWGAIPRSELDAWGEDYVNHGPPQGESFQQLALRVNAVINDCLKHYSGKNLLLITHAGVIRAILSQALCLSLKDSFRLKIDYCSLTKIDYTMTYPHIDFINR